MNTLTLPPELQAIEKLREEELEEARSIQSVMMPAEALRAGDRRLMIRGMPRRHAAIQYAVFDPQTNDLHIASAGMPGPFHLCAEGCRLLELSGIPPGLSPSASYETVTIPLHAGDSVLFCTDGITDAFDRHGEQFGLERLQGLCGDRRHLSPTELLGQIFSVVEEFARGREQHDDMAAAVFHYSG